MSNFQIPNQLMGMLKGGDPQKIALNLLSGRAKGNPMLENLLSMANNGDEAGVTTMCKNILRSKGYDPDQLYNDFQNQFR